MRTASCLLARAGFLKRSLDEFKRQSKYAINLEGLRRPTSSLEMWEFKDQDAVDACVDMSDQDIGGYSMAVMRFVPAIESEPAHLHFSGHISNRLPVDQKQVERTGYAAWRTEDRPFTMFGKPLWSVDQHAYLALRIKSDGRKYKVNIQTESVIPTDIHQHRLYAQKPGSWETVLIRWRDFVRTNGGLVVEPQSEMMRDQIRTIGIGLTDRVAGPFEICISRIWATNRLTEEELKEADEPAPVLLPKSEKSASEADPVHLPSG